jgi:hypothetical protein
MGIKKLRFLNDFGVFSAYYKLDCELGLSASFHFADFPEWRPYSKLFNEPLRASFPFLLLVCLRERAPDAA